MEELTWVIEDALSWLVATWKNEILTTVNVVQEVSNTPDLILHVQNLDTWSTVTSFISQYIPFFSQYTDTEFFFFCLVALIWIMVVIWVFRDAIKWERRLWRESLEMDICECHHCWALNKESSRMCVWCWECLVVECKECHKEYNNSYAYCPNCWAPNLE